MPRIEVDCLLRHCTDPEIRREQPEWQALHAVNVIKGKPLRGSFNFQITGLGGVSISASNAQLFLREVCIRSANHIRNKYGNDVCIVPIPNSTAVATNQKPFRTSQLARAIAQQVGAPCASLELLRWRKEVGQTHKGERCRDVDQHIDLMRLISRTEQRIILFDDVVTSGSQLAAAELLLTANGMRVAGMLAVAEVVNQGQRSDTPSWRTAVRTPRSMRDFLDALE